MPGKHKAEGLAASPKSRPESVGHGGAASKPSPEVLPPRPRAGAPGMGSKRGGRRLAWERRGCPQKGLEGLLGPEASVRKHVPAPPRLKQDSQGRTEAWGQECAWVHPGRPPPGLRAAREAVPSPPRPRPILMLLGRSQPNADSNERPTRSPVVGSRPQASASAGSRPG